MASPSVIIAGGGVIGLMTGFMLARAGASPLVVDAGLPASTMAAAGMLAPSFEPSLGAAGGALAAFGRRGLDRWPRVAALLAERSGVDCDFRRGVLSAAFDADEAAALRAGEGGAWLARDDVRALEPSIAPNVVGGRYAQEDAQVDPRRVIAALEKALVHDGGRIRRGKAVVSLRAGDAVAVRLHDGETIEADHVVVATGARLPDCGGLLAPDAIVPVKGEALALAPTAGGPVRVVRTARAYLCPKADGRLVVGATEIAGDRSLNPDSARVDALLKGARAAFPALENAAEISRWAGVRPATADGAPIIGAAPGAKAVLFALGHYRNGILMAPATADAIVRLVVEGLADPAIAAFSAARVQP